MAIASVLTTAVSSRRRLLVEICANAVLQLQARSPLHSSSSAPSLSPSLSRAHAP